MLNNHSQMKTNDGSVYNLCFIGKKKQNKNKIVELLRMIARAVLIHGLIGWQCKSHSPLTRKTQTAGWRRRDKNVDSCGSRGISTEGMRRRQREKKTTRGCDKESWVRDKQWYEVVNFRGIHVNIRPHRARKHSDDRTHAHRTTDATILKCCVRVGGTQPLDMETINDLSRLHRSHKKKKRASPRISA